MNVVVTAPCQKCGERISAGRRGYGWSFLCPDCFTAEVKHDDELTTPGKDTP